MVSALAIFGGSTTLVLVGVVVWLTYRNGKSRDAESAARDLYRNEKDVSAEWRGRHELEAAAHHVTKGELAKERALRKIVEAHRNSAVQRAQELLRQHMRSATDDEIRDHVAHLFGTPLAAVARIPLSETPGNELMEP